MTLKDTHITRQEYGEFLKERNERELYFFRPSYQVKDEWAPQATSLEPAKEDGASPQATDKRDWDLFLDNSLVPAKGGTSTAECWGSTCKVAPAISPWLPRAANLIRVTK